MSVHHLQRWPTLNQHWFNIWCLTTPGYDMTRTPCLENTRRSANVGAMSTTLGQYQYNIGLPCRACWVVLRSAHTGHRWRGGGGGGAQVNTRPGPATRTNPTSLSHRRHLHSNTRTRHPRTGAVSHRYIWLALRHTWHWIRRQHRVRISRLILTDSPAHFTRISQDQPHRIFPSLDIKPHFLSCSTLCH